MGAAHYVFTEICPIRRGFGRIVRQIARYTGLYLRFFGGFLRGERTRAKRVVVRTSRAKIRDLPHPSGRHGCRPNRA